MIRYFRQECRFNLKNRRLISRWIKEAALEEGFRSGEIGIIFCSDPYLMEMNRNYLGHDYPTDVITFDYRDPLKSDMVSGDIFVSIDRVKENAGKYHVEWPDELYRVMIHGIMHLCGYKDGKRSESMKMRERENYYLAKLTIP